MYTAEDVGVTKRGMRLTVLALGAFVMSTYFSYGELKYLLRGKTADATIMQASEVLTGSRHQIKVLRVEYRFADTDGKTRTEQDDVDVDWPIPDDLKTKVQFISGVPDGSRLAGHRRIFWVYIFFACMAVLGFCVVELWREASDKTHTHRELSEAFRRK